MKRTHTKKHGKMAFTRNATKVHKKNVPSTVMRGGFRL
jgi:hypothetical protein